MTFFLDHLPLLSLSHTFRAVPSSTTAVSFPSTLPSPTASLVEADLVTISPILRPLLSYSQMISLASDHRYICPEGATAVRGVVLAGNLDGIGSWTVVAVDGPGTVPGDAGAGVIKDAPFRCVMSMVVMLHALTGVIRAGRVRLLIVDDRV